MPHAEDRLSVLERGEACQRGQVAELPAPGEGRAFGARSGLPAEGGSLELLAPEEVERLEARQAGQWGKVAELPQ